MKRHIFCHFGGHHSKDITFAIAFGDGFSLDIADTQQQDAVDHFEQLVSLTNNAKTITSGGEDIACPANVALFVMHERQAW